MQNRPPDPFVRDSLAAGNPGSGDSLAGLWGESDRPGCRRLYLTTKLDYFVEFRLDQVVAVESVPPEAPPFVGLDATRVTLTPDATLDWVRRQVGAADAFLLEARDEIVQPPELTTWGADCPGVTVPFGQSDFLECDPGGGHPGGGTGTFGPLPTRGGRTCAETCAGGTCVTCDGGTCVTCGRNTCVTCEGPRCQSLAGTCWTCGRATCRGCTQDACGTGVGGAGSWGATCEGTCVSCRGTCDNTCVSCRGTCDNTCAATCQETCADTCFTCAGTCQATCDTCWTCTPTCDLCETARGWCIVRA